MKARRSIVSMFVLLALVLAACSTSPASAPVNSAYGGTQSTAEQATVASTAAATSAQPSTAAVAIAIQNFAFDPGNITVKTGTTITWTNMDSVNHTVTSDTGLFDSGELGKGSIFSYTFDKAGVYTYYCIPHHSKMQATVTVTD